MYRVSQKVHPKPYAHISTYSHPAQTKIYPVVRHSHLHLCTSFGPLILIFVKTVTICVTLTPDFSHSVTAFCSIH